MTRTSRLLSLVICVAFAAATAPAARGQFVTPEKKRKEIVKLAIKLESQPLSKRAAKDRRKAMTLVRNASDLAVEPCRALLDELVLSKQLGAQELLAQLPISTARYAVENPSLAADRFAMLRAGLEGVLRTYAAMRRANMLVQIESLETLRERQERGELDEVVREALADCSSRQ